MEVEIDLFVAIIQNGHVDNVNTTEGEFEKYIYVIFNYEIICGKVYICNLVKQDE